MQQRYAKDQPSSFTNLIRNVTIVGVCIGVLFATTDF